MMYHVNIFNVKTTCVFRINRSSTREISKLSLFIGLNIPYERRYSKTCVKPVCFGQQEIDSLSIYVVTLKHSNKYRLSDIHVKN
jgi:hypothetical protein